MKEYNATLIDYGDGKGKLVVESKFGKVTFAVKADSHMWVELERPAGEWLTKWQDTCSQCKKEFDVPTDDNCKALWNYCPHCGADMRKEGEAE